MKNNLSIVGRAERVDLPDLQLQGVPAKIDTGADSSSIWVSDVVEKDDGLYCVFFGPGSQFYTGKIVKLTKDYAITRVANSFGHKQLRYKVKLRIKIHNRLVRATFTLSDRSSKTYPILLGRRLLTGKFLVDVSRGNALKSLEGIKAEQLKQELSTLANQKDMP